MIDAKLQDELRYKFNPEGSVLRRAQETMLSLLVFLDSVCRENNLSYWLDGGTLLGAVRHGGFIPWDDDTDVCMQRKDAMLLMDILGNKIHEGHIVLQNRKTEKNYPNSSWMTLRDTESRYIQDSYAHNRLKFQGLQLDIFIMEEGIPSYIKRFGSLLHNVLITSPLSNSHHIGFLRPLVNLNHRILDRITYPLLRKFKNNKRILNYGIGSPFSITYPAEIVFPLKELSFENKLFFCPNKPEDYLRIEYGNWEEIPSFENIGSHNAQIQFLNNGGCVREIGK
ncbi:MAG: LicD family protein [Muribaculaceae bacterium]|nr:LicD family protein [Muribaculaceae bacterium]MDE6753224.1 LicD family protein [Muribaculaceae bacterium]